MIKKVVKRPPRLLAYGIPSIGKSTLASQMPNPIFLCAEDGARELGVDAWTFDDKDRIQPKNLDEFRAALRSIIQKHDGYKTLVIDGLGELDRLVQQHLVTKNPKWGGDIQFLGYGRPESLILGVWREIIVDLEEANNSGLMVALLGHSKIEKFNPPDGATMDRYQLAVTSHKSGDVSGMLFAWTDLAGFCSFERMTQESGKRTVGVAVQGARIMHLQRLDSWDAKARFKNSPAQIPMSWPELAKVISAESASPVDIRAQITELLPQLPDDKRVATVSWLAGELSVDDLTLGLERVKGNVMLGGTQ